MHPFLQQHYGLNSPKRPILALAPMAGVTDVPFRTLCEHLGADYSVTEMAASAPQLIESEKNTSRLEFAPNANVKILQIIGNDAQQMADAAQIYSTMSADIIDINLGCPAKKISKKGAGSALLSNLPLVRDILTRIVEKCPLPVTVKTRLGTDHNNYTLFEIAEIITDLGIPLLTVHGRTRADKFNGSAQFDEIARVKQAFPKLAIIANGDITSLEKAKSILSHTQCDGLMIGRGAVGNPWLFSEVREYFDSGYQLDIQHKNELILNHIEQTHLFYGEEKGVRFARKHIQAYLQHLNISTQFAAVAKVGTAKEQLLQLEQILKVV